jgi:hypothetical protein
MVALQVYVAVNKHQRVHPVVVGQMEHAVVHAHLATGCALAMVRERPNMLLIVLAERAKIDMV